MPRLGLLARREVAGILIRDGTHRHEGVPHRAVASAEPHLAPGVRSRRGPDPVPGNVDAIDEEIRQPPAQELGGRHAEDLAQPRVGVGRPTVLADRPDPLSRGLDEALVSAFAAEQRPLLCSARRRWACTTANNKSMSIASEPNRTSRLDSSRQSPGLS